MTKKCRECGLKEAVVYQPHTGRKLCRECFLKDIRNRVRKHVLRNNLFNEKDDLLLALSGGKDSYVLLDILTHMHSTEKIIGITVIEGIPGYPREKYAKKIWGVAREKGIKVHVTSFKEYVGYSLNELVRMARKKELNTSPCTICGGIRRRIINTYAREIGAKRTLTGHTLDDEIQTFIMNILRGDPARLIRQYSMPPILSEKFVQRVKPLRVIYEWEVAMYSYLTGYKFQDKQCTFIEENPSLRARIRKRLYLLEGEKPGTMMNILKMMDKILETKIIETKKLPSLPTCRYCGEPTSYGRSICKVCEILLKIGVEPKYKLK